MDRTEFTRRRRKLLLHTLGAAVAVAAFYILGCQGIGIPCLFRLATGWLCPGCGNSRAVLALLRLDITAALQYNMLFPLEFFYLGWVLFHCVAAYLKGGRFAYRSTHLWMDIAILAILLLWWPLRNLL